MLPSPQEAVPADKYFTRKSVAAGKKPSAWPVVADGFGFLSLQSLFPAVAIRRVATGAGVYHHRQPLVDGWRHAALRKHDVETGGEKKERLPVPSLRQRHSSAEVNARQDRSLLLMVSQLEQRSPA